MAGNTKALRLRIKSVTSTLQLTKAMGLVASSKIRRANEAMLRGREYSAAFDSAVSLLTSSRECEKSPYMKKRDTSRVKTIVIAGDRGLAGGYNANIFRLTDSTQSGDIIPIGKRACERYGKVIVSSEKFSSDDAAKLADELCSSFEKEEFDRLDIVSTKYISVMSQEAYKKTILPLEKKQDAIDSPGTVFEPDHLTVLNNAVREYVSGVILACIRESFASEVSARRMAMDSAGKNAKQMISDLGLEYNRARQGAITQEITEIVAGSGN